MKIIIKNLKGEKYPIEIDPAACIIDVKRQIKKVKGVAEEKQKLVFKNRTMEDSVILSEIGIKEDDTFLLMQVIPTKKQIKKDTVEIGQQIPQQQKPKLTEKSLLENNIQKLMKLGFSKEICEQSLQKNNNNIEECMKQLTKPAQIQQNKSERLQQQIIKVLEQNKNMVQMTQNGEVMISLDLQSMIKMLGVRNEQLLTLMNQNPNGLKDLLKEYGLEARIGDEDEFQVVENQNENEEFEQQPAGDQEIQVSFSEAQQQAISRIICLGFTREQVVSAYLLCDKNQQLAANMLFNQQQNQGFDLQ